MAKRDYFEVLGVSRDASDDEIKKAYKKLAIKYHPDRQGDKSEAEKKAAEEKFKEAAEAYDILRDPQKREQYKQFGHAAFEHGGAGGGGPFGAGMSMDDIFSMFGDIFGGRGGGFGGGFGRGGYGRAQKPVYKGRDQRMQIELDLNEVVNGAKKKFKLRTDVKCPHCNGSGSTDGKLEKCGSCGGQGYTIRTQQSLFGMMQSQVECRACGGEGEIIKNKCPHCGGEGIIKGEKLVELDLPAGMIEGYAFNSAGNGGAGRRNGVSGDLQVLIHEKPHPELVRDGLDLIYNLLLTIPQATLGCSVEVPTHDGKAKINIQPGTQPGTVLRLRNKGIPDVNSYVHSKGDELINISVYIPETLTKEERKAIETLQGSDNMSAPTSIKDKIFNHFRSYFKK